MVRKIKIGKIEVNFSNRWLYTLIAIGIVILLGIAVYSWENSAGVGHGLNELEPCGDGQILKTSGSSWTCVPAPSFVDTDTNTYCSVSGNTISCPDGTSLSDTSAQTECGNTQYMRGDSNCRTASQIVSDGGGGMVCDTLGYLELPPRAGYGCANTRWMIRADQDSMNQRCREQGYRFGYAASTFSYAQWCYYCNARTAYWNYAAQSWTKVSCSNYNVRQFVCCK